MKYGLKYFLAFLLLSIASGQALGDYYRNQATLLINTIVSANSANDLFNARAAMPFGSLSRELELYVFNIYRQRDPQSVVALMDGISASSPIYRDKQLSESLFTSANLMLEMGFLHQEMIDLAKEKIKASTHSSGPHYENFAQDADVIAFYDRKYSDRWIRTNSKEWIYVVAGALLIHENAKRNIELGERLGNPDLVNFGRSLYCSLIGFKNSEELCLSADQLYTQVRSKADSDRLVREAQRESEAELAKRQSELEAVQREREALAKVGEIQRRQEFDALLMEQQQAEELSLLEQQKLEIEMEEKQMLSSIGSPDYLVNAPEIPLGYIQPGGPAIGSGLELRKVVAGLLDHDCQVKYRGVRGNDKSFSINVKGCEIMLPANETPLGPSVDFRASNFEFDVSHFQYMLLDIYTLQRGTLGNTDLESFFVTAILSRYTR